MGRVAIAFLMCVFLSLNLRSADALVEVLDTAFFGGTLYGSSENVAYIEEGKLLNVRCIPEATVLSSSLTQKPEFQWVNPHTGVVLFNMRMVMLPNGELQIKNSMTDDSGVYLCHMFTKGQIQKVSYKHTVIVYTIPVYRKIFQFVYVAKACDRGLISKLMKEIEFVVCGDLGDKCTFEIVEIPCEKYRSEVHLKVNVTVHGSSMFAAPKCGPKCARQAYINNLDRDVVKDKMKMLQRSSEDIFTDLTGFKFDSTRTTEEIVAVCPDGHIIFKELVCIPCMHGYFKHRNDNYTCRQCGVYSYQPKFGSSECIRCPQYGFSEYVASPSVKLCRPIWKTWQGITVISIIVAVTCLICFLILLHLGAFPFIYETDSVKKLKKKKEMGKDLQSLMEYYDPKKKEAEEKQKQTLLARTKPETKRWYPGIGWT